MNDNPDMKALIRESAEVQERILAAEVGLLALRKRAAELIELVKQAAASGPATI